MVGLGTLPGAGSSGAAGVSGDGSVVVGSSLLSTGFEAFRWTSGGGMVGLGDLPGGAFHSGANGASGDGLVVVGNSYSASGQEAFRWTSGGGMVGLGDLPGGSFGSSAEGVSADGSVVVGYGNLSLNSSEAFRWTRDRGMERLWDVLLAQGIDPAADGWTTLTGAFAISADGNTIVGTGTRGGNNEAFIAVIPTVVPEPAAGALALMGMSSILLVGRRSLGRPNKVSLSKDEPCD